MTAMQDSDRYDAGAVELKWHDEWERRGTNRFTDEDLSLIHI